MKDILEVMKYIYLNPDKYDERSLQKEFSKGDTYDASQYKKFKDFAYQSKDPYVRIVKGKFSLTGVGIREYHELSHKLKLEEKETRQAEANIYATGAMAAASVVLAISAIFDWIASPDYLKVDAVTKIAAIISLVALFTIIFWKINKILNPQTSSMKKVEKISRNTPFVFQLLKHRSIMFGLILIGIIIFSVINIDDNRTRLKEDMGKETTTDFIEKDYELYLYLKNENDTVYINDLNFSSDAETGATEINLYTAATPSFSKIILYHPYGGEVESIYVSDSEHPENLYMTSYQNLCKVYEIRENLFYCELSGLEKWQRILFKMKTDVDPHGRFKILLRTAPDWKALKGTYNFNFEIRSQDYKCAAVYCFTSISNGLKFGYFLDGKVARYRISEDRQVGGSGNDGYYDFYLNSENQRLIDEKNISISNHIGGIAIFAGIAFAAWLELLKKVIG